MKKGGKFVINGVSAITCFLFTIHLLKKKELPYFYLFFCRNQILVKFMHIKPTWAGCGRVVETVSFYYFPIHCLQRNGPEAFLLIENWVTSSQYSLHACTTSVLLENPPKSLWKPHESEHTWSCWNPWTAWKVIEHGFSSELRILLNILSC